MGTKVNSRAYKQLIDEDIEWLNKQPNTLENQHIKQIVEDSINFYYDKDTVEKLNMHIVSISLPSREEYDQRKLKPLYFLKDTSVGNSVLFIKGDEYQPYNWNYKRMIEYIKEGRLGYDC